MKLILKRKINDLNHVVGVPHWNYDCYLITTCDEFDSAVRTFSLTIPTARKISKHYRTNVEELVAMKNMIEIPNTQHYFSKGDEVELIRVEYDYLTFIRNEKLIIYYVYPKKEVKTRAKLVAQRLNFAVSYEFIEAVIE